MIVRYESIVRANLRTRPFQSANAALLTVVLLASLGSGCASSEQWIQRRPADSPYAARLLGVGNDKPRFSETTRQVATKAGLNPEIDDQRQRLLTLLADAHGETGAPEVEFALAELAAVQADSLREDGDDDAAIGFYAESLVHGYHALAGDPLRRIGGATSRYNTSLQSLLRLLQSRDQVHPGARIPLPHSEHGCSIAVELHSSHWRQEDFDGFEFAEDFQVLALRNHYHTTGVGVPLVAKRDHPDRNHPEDRFYPTTLCYPLTAFVRVESADHHQPATPAADPHQGLRLVLELHDTMEHEQLNLAGRRTPLASDLTTPLAYFLNQPQFQESKISNSGLFQPEQLEAYQGLYLLEPYDPNRIPVVMVHGLWSSPATWMEMFNDLRSDPRIRSRYQFWFYLYPTASPFFVSAAQMREDLQQVKQTFDPNDSTLAMDQMVLVGHSMGGLMSRLQAVNSGDDFWRVVATDDFSKLKADEESRTHVSRLFYFQPDSSVRRVVTIGSPHRGSRFANGVTRWVGNKLIELPVKTIARRQELFRDNPGLFLPAATSMMTSLDSLAPDSPMLSALLTARSAPWVSYHNVVGDAPRSGPASWFTTRGDGVVSLASARLDDLPGLESQVIVPDSHVTLHRHPQTVAEVQRILLAQAAELEGYDPLQASLTIPRSSPAMPTVRLVSGSEPLDTPLPASVR
ncbi:esterase/lipase family protein [Botrimarina hoheduenensis]|uniref:Alpha/beta hydrolase family protein n=1 Tax=Botrimarina hoheduenensis TaxID=2528000 RepID=A0A5C5WD02_9BACT|nr:alpha/beta fold hydrolase [Botrimarina hoheduenensis]TWT48796.1 Alpha/beta hydrolase family protein [Botrimarina hoheduenensis]